MYHVHVHVYVHGSNSMLLCVTVAAFPAPMVFGKVIDMACLVQQTSCTRKGACIFYDNDDFRVYLHGLAAFIKFAAFMGYFSAFCFSRNFEFPSQEPPEKKKESEYGVKGNDTETEGFVDDTTI